MENSLNEDLIVRDFLVALALLVLLLVLGSLKKGVSGALSFRERPLPIAKPFMQLFVHWTSMDSLQIR